MGDNKNKKPRRLDCAAGIVTILWLSYIYGIVIKSDIGIIGTLFISVWGLVLILAYLIQKG
jgi:hypothetical protein